ncbi:MAG: hypothetical protein AMK71_11425 [Nitrospira bacterium SG8_35_4]|nr:MAG: hypothetical protein AMK71_11425 [Nitrospira bacterium SG8_35_4]
MKNLKKTTLKLLNYCRVNHWEGYDPYDALNSRLFRLLPFLDSRFPRIAFIQALKRAPFNLRPLLLIPKTQNPKAMGLFLMALLKLDRLGQLDQGGLIPMIIDRLSALRSPGMSYYCWGYSFPWQTRTVIVARGAPNLVCTIFVADALLDAFEDGRDERCLSMAHSAAQYILDELYWIENGSTAGFSYPVPGLKTEIHNANFLASALLGRIHKHTGEKKFLEPALNAARYSSSKQNDDGSWYYGELPKQRWVDNFHTGFNLGALRDLGQHLGTSEFDLNIQRGFTFYLQNFFTENGAPKYFHDRTYPIDIHSVAQSIITLLEFGHLNGAAIERACSVYSWAMDNMWDSRGYFYYRSYPLGRSKISYMRWSQAWMLLALSSLLEETSGVPGRLTADMNLSNQGNQG